MGKLKDMKDDQKNGKTVLGEESVRACKTSVSKGVLRMKGLLSTDVSEVEERKKKLAKAQPQLDMNYPCRKPEQKLKDKLILRFVSEDCCRYSFRQEEANQLKG